MPEEFLSAIQQTVAKHRLFPPHARLIVAVSGGLDSVVLLHALAQLRKTWALRLHIAHLDHALRDSSREDAAFVRSLGERYGIRTTVERQEVASICAQEGWSLEEGARRIRYRFLLQVALRESAGYLALAHTADDQAETVLMRLMRGTGLMGLGAIPIKRSLEEGRAPSWAETVSSAPVWLVRPLLETWRRNLSSWAEQERLSHRSDPTNGDERFVRNRIRHRLLPLLERDYNPNIKRVLTQLAEQSRCDYAYLKEAAQRQWKRMAREERVCPPAERSSEALKRGSKTGTGAAGASKKPEPRIAISIALFLRQPEALQRQLVRQAIRRLRGDTRQFEFRHWLEAERLFRGRPAETLLELPGGIQLRRERERVICQRAQTLPSTTSFED